MGYCSKGKNMDMCDGTETCCYGCIHDGACPRKSSNREKICPVKSGYDTRCVSEQCGWWDKRSGQCAIITIATNPK